jgi:hypothetical protein
MTSSLLNELIGATVAALRQTRMFSRVVATAATVERPTDFLMEIDLIGTREVSHMQRAFLGAFAGTASLSAEVRVLDTSTSKVVGKAVVGANTSGGNKFAGTTSEAVDRFAEQIVEFVLGR